MLILNDAYRLDYQQLDKLPLKLQAKLEFKYSGNAAPLKNIYAIHKETDTIERYIVSYNKNDSTATRDRIKREEEDNIDLYFTDYEQEFKTIGIKYFNTQLKENNCTIDEVYNMYENYLENKEDDSVELIYDEDSPEATSKIELAQSIISDVACDVVTNDYIILEDKHDLLIAMYKEFTSDLKDIDIAINKLTLPYRIQITYLDLNNEFVLYKNVDKKEGGEEFNYDYDQYEL